MIKSIYTKWEEVELEKPSATEETKISQYYAGKDIHNRIYFGVDWHENKKIYIEFDKEALSDYDLPNIKGMKIYKAACESIDKNKEYLIIINESESDEVFLAFASTLIDKIKDAKTDYKTLSYLEETIKFYKEYFANSNKQLSDSEEQGLCGELIVLKDLITKNNEEYVKFWLGPDKNKRDFVFENSALEVKTILNQEETSITISNENQLDKGKLNELLLYVCIFEQNPNGKINVINCYNDILSILSKPNIIKEFKSKIITMGIDASIYKPKQTYTLENIKKYQITDDFPCLTKKNIPPVVFNVKYKINLNSLDKYLLKEGD